MLLELKSDFPLIRIQAFSCSIPKTLYDATLWVGILPIHPIFSRVHGNNRKKQYIVLRRTLFGSSVRCGLITQQWHPSVPCRISFIFLLIFSQRSILNWWDGLGLGWGLGVCCIQLLYIRTLPSHQYNLDLDIYFYDLCMTKDCSVFTTASLHLQLITSF